METPQREAIFTGSRDRDDTGDSDINGEHANLVEI